MTVGESIRFYREKQGLSMEELGRKLQVSQQTVALWETDKTLPTAENLLRLREIFGVPVDAILTASSMPPPAEEPPRETHRFRYSHTELKAVFRALSWKRYWRGMIIYVLLMLCLFALMAAADDSGILACIVLGAFLPGVILRIKGYLKNRKAWESGARRMLGCTYTYELYDWYLKLTVSRDGKIRKTMRIDFFDIERTQEIRGFLVLWAEGQMLLVKTDALYPGSFFYTQCQFSRNRTVKPHGLALPDDGNAAPDLGRAAAVRDSIRETGVFDETDPAVGSRMAGAQTADAQRPADAVSAASAEAGSGSPASAQPFAYRVSEQSAPQEQNTPQVQPGWRLQYAPPVRPMRRKAHPIGVLLLVASILSLYGALLCAILMSGGRGDPTRSMWILYLFTPIPITSIVLGFFFKKRGFRYQANIIIGIIMTAILCLYGSFSILFAGIYTHTDEPIVRAEQLLDIDIPVHERIDTMENDTGSPSASGYRTFSTSDIYFGEDAVADFEEQIRNDGRWLRELPSELIGIMSPYAELPVYDYVMIYNVDTGEFNSLPEESGTYRMFNVLYNSDSRTMKLVEYQIEFVK